MKTLPISQQPLTGDYSDFKERACIALGIDPNKPWQLNTQQERAHKLREEKIIQPYATYHMYTDSVAYEVIRVISPITVEVRALKDEIIEKPVDFYPGGFFGHYADNHKQKHVYESDPNGEVTQIRWSETKGYWVSKGRRFTMDSKPCSFHDYNF